MQLHILKIKKHIWVYLWSVQNEFFVPVILVIITFWPIELHLTCLCCVQNSLSTCITSLCNIFKLKENGGSPAEPQPEDPVRCPSVAVLLDR